MVDTIAQKMHEVGPNLLSAINIICAGIVGIVTAVLGYLGGRTHQIAIVNKKNGNSK